MRSTITLGLVAAVGLAVLGCDTTPVAPPDLNATFDHRGTPHGGGGNGGHPGDGGASGLFDVNITGGFELYQSGIELDRDQKQRLNIDISTGQWSLTQTHYWADLERRDPAAASVCYFDPADQPDDVKQQLVAALLVEGSEGFLSVNKVDARGMILTKAPVWMGLGADPDATAQEDHRAFVDDGGSGVDWNDASATRVFRFTGGVVRTLLPIGENGVAHPKLKCENQDVVVATVAPAAGG